MKKSKLHELVNQEISKLLKEIEYDSGEGTKSYDNPDDYKKLDTSHYVNSIRNNIVTDLHESLEIAAKMFNCRDAKNRRNKPQRLKFLAKPGADAPGLYLLDVKDVNILLDQINNRVTLEDFTKKMTSLVEGLVQSIADSEGRFTANKYSDYKLNLKKGEKMYATFTIDKIPPCDFYVRFTKVKTYKNQGGDNFDNLLRIQSEGGGAAGIRKFVQEHYIRKRIDKHLKQIDQYLGSIIEKKEDKEVIAKNKAAAEKRAKQEEIKARFEKLKAKIERSRNAAEDFEKAAQQNADGVAKPGPMRSFEQGHSRFAFIKSFTFAVLGTTDAQLNAAHPTFVKNKRTYFKGLKPKDLIPLWDKLLTKGERIASLSKEKFPVSNTFIKIGNETVNIYAIEKHIKETSAKSEESSEEQGESGQDTPDWSQRQEKALEITIDNPSDVEKLYPRNISELKEWLYRRYFLRIQSSRESEDQNESLSPIQKYILKEQDSAPGADSRPDTPPLGFGKTDEQLEEAIKAIQEMLNIEVTGIYDLDTHTAWAANGYKVPAGAAPTEEPAAEEERSSVEPVDPEKFTKAKEKMNEEYFRKFREKGGRSPGSIHALSNWLGELSYFIDEILPDFKSNTPEGQKTLTPEIFNAIMKLQEKLRFGESGQDGIYGPGTHRRVMFAIQKKYFPKVLQTYKNKSTLAKAIVLEIYAKTADAGDTHDSWFADGDSYKMADIVERGFNQCFPGGKGTDDQPADLTGHGIDPDKILPDNKKSSMEDPKNLTSFLSDDFFLVSLIEEEKNIRVYLHKMTEYGSESGTTYSSTSKLISKALLMKTWNSIKDSLTTQAPAPRGPAPKGPAPNATPGAPSAPDQENVTPVKLPTPENFNKLLDQYIKATSPAPQRRTPPKGGQ